MQCHTLLLHAEQIIWANEDTTSENVCSKSCSGHASAPCYAIQEGGWGAGGGNGVGAEEQGANGLAGTEMYSAQSSCKPNAVHPMLLCEEKST